MKLLKALWWIYAVAGVAAIAFIPASAKGWIGEPDPLAAVFAVVLALPWSMWLDALGREVRSPWLGTAALAAGIALNLLVFHLLGRLIARHRMRAADRRGS